MAGSGGKPEPIITDLNRPFWEGARRSRLMLQKCRSCGHIRFPVGPVCTACLSPATEWAEMSGQGEVLAHLVFHQVYDKAWAGDVPYSVVLVQLDEGPRIFSNIAGPAHAETQSDLVGCRVRAVFDPINDQIGRHSFVVVQR